MAKRDCTEADQRLSKLMPIAEMSEVSADAADAIKTEGLADAAGRVAEVDIDRIEARLKGMFKGRVSSPVSCAEMDEAIADAVVEEFDASTGNCG